MSMTIIWTIIVVMSIIVEAVTINLVSIWFALGGIFAIVGDLLGATPIQQKIFICDSSITFT